MEKSKSLSHVQTVTVNDEPPRATVPPPIPYWKPGYGKQFPLLGFGAILLVLACALGSVIVLVVSNGKSSTQWTQTMAPSVVLSMFNAVSNLALLIAVSRGAAIAWWRKALHGATVYELHNAWGQSSSSYEVLRNIFSPDKIGIAALAAKIAVIDGILLQKATSNYIGQDPAKYIPMMGAASLEFPQTGYVVNDRYGAQANCECFMIGDVFTPVVNTWETSNGFFSGYNKFFQACDGTCFAYIEAIGFEVTCTKNQNFTNLASGAISAYNATGGSSSNSSAWNNIPIFNSSFTVTFADASRNYSTIDLSLLYFQSSDPYNPSSATCPGTVSQVQCSLRPALLTYPVTITNYTNEHITNGVSLGIFTSDDTRDVDEEINGSPNLMAYDFTNKQVQGVQVNSYLYPNESKAFNSSTYLGGIANALSQYLSSSASITYTGQELWALKQSGTLAQTMMYGPPNMGSCDCSFKESALDTIINSVNQLTFLTATGLIDPSTFGFPPAANNKLFSSVLSKQSPAITVNSSTTVTVQGIGKNTTTNFRALSGTLEIRDVTHYHTDFVFVGIAAGLTVLCVLLICPLYWKYGELGREVTLGPIEIAGAFRAPILSTAAHPPPSSDGANGKIQSVPPTPISPTMPSSPTAPTIAFANVKELIEEVGQRKVTYGFVDVHEPTHESQDGNTITVPGSPISPTAMAFKRRSVLAFEDASHPDVRPAASKSPKV